QVPVQRLQQRPEGGGMPRSDLVQQSQDRDGVALVALLAGQLRQAQQAQRGARAAGGNRRVLELLAPHDQGFLLVGGGREEAAALGVGKAPDQLLGEARGLGQPALLARGFEQRDQRLEQEGIILEVARDLRLPVVVDAQQLTALVAQLAEDELSAGERRLEQRRRDPLVGVRRVAQERSGLRQGADHERVPRRQALAVEPRAHPLLARREQPRANALASLRRRARAAALEDVEPGPGIVRVAEVALLARSEPGDSGLGVLAQQLAQLGGPPHVVAALGALGVGVERGVEAALGAAHLAQRPAEHIEADLEQVAL